MSDSTPVVEALRKFVNAIYGYDDTGVWPDNRILRELAEEGRRALGGELLPQMNLGDAYVANIAAQVAEEIYRAYPRKVGKPAALKSIRRAMKKTTPLKILASTHKFAELWSGVDDKTMCPHPSTWFNQERFNDDPKEWNRPNVVKASPGVPAWKRIEMLEAEETDLYNWVQHEAYARQHPDKVKRLREVRLELSKLRAAITQ